MTESVIVAFISGGLALIGTVITCVVAARRTDETIRIHQAVTDTKIEELTREVREHNHFAQRIPVTEEQIRALSHRIAQIERTQKDKGEISVCKSVYPNC